MGTETEPLSFPGLQQTLGSFVKLPSCQQIKYWDDIYRDIPKDIRDENMSAAQRKLCVLLMDTEFRTVYKRLPIDIQSCLPIYMAAEEDLMYIDVMEHEYEMTA